ncbi:cilia- and flagella-associated protein 61-like [Liolophura sinensis]|uniref:cilia- and flagella-associated protein 61-like n=1 Tax=Liolophura sinensis TaxID=3198878 RepID=UPI003158B2AE
MTTVVSPEGASDVINARRTESLDAPSILSLVTPATESLFGRVNVVNLIEKAVLAVTLSNDKEEILGHAAFFDYPSSPEVDPAEWESWMVQNYNTEDSTALNTLFMHYFVAKKEYAHGCAKEIIRTVFNAVPDLHFCFFMAPAGVYPDPCLSDIFKIVNKVVGTKGAVNSNVFGCFRHDHVPVLHVRRARIEDHDDLTPIFNRQSDMLSRTYGDFFLGELIDAQDEHMHCLVAEVDGTAIGFMSMSDDVNVNLLNECFELAPFHGLRKPHPEDMDSADKTFTATPPTLENQVSQPSDRPTCGESSKSEGSKASGVSCQSADESKEREKKADVAQEEQVPQDEATGKLPGHKSPQADEEVKVSPKLSDANMGGSAASLISEGSEVGSEKSAGCHTPPPSKNSRPGIESGSPRILSANPETAKAQLPKRFVPVYKGGNNAFCVQLFCVDERYEMRSADFLEKAFSLYPDKEFCVITVPHLVPVFPLLQSFVRVTPRCPSTLPQELYVFNRYGLLKNFTVRRACTADYEGVEKLVKTIDLHENLLKDLQQFNRARRDQDGTEIQAFVAECQKQIVGIAIIRREEDIEYIRSHYNIEDFIYYNHHKREEHGHLHHYALSPIFQHLSKHFLKEVLRRGHKTCLYYPLYPAYSSKETVEQHSLVSALHDMVPVRSRRQIIYPLEELGENAPSKRVLAERESYALNHINRKLVLEPKVIINARIVVVGASDVGIAFLETLAYCPHLQFNNLVLISPHGLPGEMAKDELRDSMLSQSHCYSHDEYAKISLRTWVNVVYGKMTAIDRKKKHVIVSGNAVVPYDHLVLCLGQQYQVPAPTQADFSVKVTNSHLPHPPDRLYTGPVPNNVFLVNDAYDAAVVLHWVENNLMKTEGKAVVYGHTLDAYCCVQALINLGLPGNKITLVKPPLVYEVTCFNNPEIDEAVFESLKSLGVEIHSGYYLSQWNDGQGGEELTSASFTSADEPLRLDCGAFFAYYKKGVDVEAFRAINDACLVFDGKLVIDTGFHTNDLSIRGAGPLTKFQRRYHADQWTHANFNSKEVGIALASALLRMFDPTVEPEPEPPQQLLNLIPIYRSPKIEGGLLPGGYHYLHVAKPGLHIPLKTHMSHQDYGHELKTGKPGDDQGFFRLHLNPFRTIETITCLSKKPLAVDNLVCLYGLHERYLNNLQSRFDEGLIKDFFSYFAGAWCLAIYHDRFPDFRDEVRELLITRPPEDIETLEEKVRQLVDEDIPTNLKQRQELRDYYIQSGCKRAVETRLLSFLSYNYYHLPMYAKPGMV